MVQDGITTSYTYDALGQLIRVVDGQEGATWEYTYDQGGNILTKKKFVDGVETESTDFEYTNTNWRDQLTKVNGTTITYDQIGNPLNDGEWTYTWQNGRQLASMTNGETTASFIYNENGLRVQKTVNGVVTNYTLHGKNVVHMAQGNDELHFFYDASNKPAIVVYNGTLYSYVKNLQGDIVAILDAASNVAVSYVYDAWGRPISKTGSMAATLGTVQPFRYRGYVYDEETGLHYLQSRYYNACRSRFVNSDRVMTQNLCCNLFSYCLNTPVCRTDALGTESIAADAWLYIQQNGMNIAMADGPLPLCELALLGIVGGATVLTIGEWTYNSLVDLYEYFTAGSAVTVAALSSKIEWDNADKNHVLNGSKIHGYHDWRIFGIDPNDPNAWEKLIPILMEVVDKGVECFRGPASGNEGELVRYSYYFPQQAVSVIVRLFIAPDGSIRLSDAWPLVQ